VSAGGGSRRVLAEELGQVERLLREPLGVLVVGQHLRQLSRKTATQLGSSPTTGVPRRMSSRKGVEDGQHGPGR
jgi:hypothetical protein